MAVARWLYAQFALAKLLLAKRALLAEKSQGIGPSGVGQGRGTTANRALNRPLQS